MTAIYSHLTRPGERPQLVPMARLQEWSRVVDFEIRLVIWEDQESLASNVRPRSLASGRKGRETPSIDSGELFHLRRQVNITSFVFNVLRRRPWELHHDAILEVYQAAESLNVEGSNP